MDQGRTGGTHVDFTSAILIEPADRVAQLRAADDRVLAEQHALAADHLADGDQFHPRHQIATGISRRLGEIMSEKFLGEGNLAAGKDAMNQVAKEDIARLLDECEKNLTITGQPGDKYTRYMKNEFHQLLDEGKEFTAVFAFSDTMAVGACRAIAEAGKRIPQDYSVAGFDGIELCSYYNPTLTTIRQPIREIAEESVHHLSDLLDGKSSHQHKIFPGELLEQESTRAL